MKKAMFVLSIISLSLSVVHLILVLTDLYIKHCKKQAVWMYKIKRHLTVSFFCAGKWKKWNKECKNAMSFYHKEAHEWLYRIIEMV